MGKASRKLKVIKTYLRQLDQLEATPLPMIGNYDIVKEFANIKDGLIEKLCDEFDEEFKR